MKKLFLIALLIFPCVIRGQSKSFVQQKDWDSIIARMTREDWDNADKLIAASLKNCPKDSLEGQSASRLRYMYLLTEAGLMNKNKLSKEKALDHVKSFEGHLVTLPGVLISLEFGYNALLPKQGKTDTLFINNSNKTPTETEIFCITYIVLAHPVTMKEFSMDVGLTAWITGTIRSIEVADVYLSWFKILIDKAELKTTW